MNDSTVKTFVKAIKAEKKDPSPYDTTAKVTRVEGNTVWVHISGGVDETPVRRTVNAKVGDEVQVRVGGGKAWITGNASSPPTDDTRAIKADTNALRAKDIADSALNYAETAADAAGRAITSATQAANAAASAQTSANNAQTSANNAAEYASRALGGLSTVQNVAETLTWITQHGTMALTTDVALDPTHVYFVLDPAGDYTVGGNTYAIVTEPNVNDIGTYYELTIDESLNNYVGTHLALTGEGLWLLPASSGTNKVLVATGAGTTYTTAGTYIIDSGGATVASFRSDGITLGDATSYKFDVDLSGVKLTQNINGTNYEMLDLGYDSSVPAPERVTRYSLGSRKTTSTAYSSSGTYNIGDMCLYNDKVWVCNTAITTPEAFNTSHWDKYIGGTSFATGINPIASGNYSFCEGRNNIAIGEAAHAEGYNTIARGDHSHASGEGTLAYQKSQFVIGEYNTNTICMFVIGNGTADNARSNAFTVSKNGDTYAAGNINIASGKKYQINGTNLSASDVGAVPTSRTVNNKALSSNISLTASDVSAVPTSRTVNSKALSSNITLTASDVSAISTSDKYKRSSAGDLQWTNQTDGDAKVMAKSGVAFWNGAYNGTSSNLKYSVNGEILGKTNVKDYVTATGSDGIWKYRKWSSGRIECWGSKTWSSVACTTSAGGGYRSADQTVSLPSGLFTAIESCQATMKGSGGSGYAMALRTLCTTTTVTQMFWNTSSATKTNLVVDYYIIGT